MVGQLSFQAKPDNPSQHVGPNHAHASFLLHVVATSLLVRASALLVVCACPVMFQMLVYPSARNGGTNCLKLPSISSSRQRNNGKRRSRLT